MEGPEFQKEELSSLIRMTFDNTLVEDIQKIVIPVLQNKFGNVDGLLAKLGVKKETGIMSSEVENRKTIFGSNKVEQEPQTALWKLMWDALQDPTLIFLTCAAIFSLFIGIFVEQRPLGWLEGSAILFAVLVVVTVGAANDYEKERQFRSLNAKRDDIPITLFRDSAIAKISVFDIVVGDIILLSTGDIIPCDGVVLGRNDLEINEKMLTGESDLKKKSPLYQISGETVRSGPTLFAGTYVQAGEGRMLALAVGRETYQGKMEDKMKEVECDRSVLQKKLDDMTELITSVGMYVSVALVVLLCIRMTMAFHFQNCCKESWDHKVHWSELLGFTITGITIFVVAVPEGLPLAVTIALAFSVNKMLKDQNLVRHLSACETMGGATTICSDKTGTLTTARMTAVKVWCGGTLFANISQLSLDAPKVVEPISTAAVVNCISKSYLTKDKSGKPLYFGNDTDCALLSMSNEMGVPYETVRAKHSEDADGRRCLSFTSERKRMSTIVPRPSDVATLFTKGAAEVVSDLCTAWIRVDGQSQPLDSASRSLVRRAIADMADDGLRTLCIASRSLPKDKDYLNATPDQLEQDLTLLCLVGIEDPLRDEVPGAIADCKRAGIVVRMVTGDNARTARAIARKCGILQSDEDVVMEGKAFRERVCNAQGEIIQEAFDEIWPTLRVLARSTPLDKHVLVSGIQESTVGLTRQTVAVTGDGTNDAPALKKADVGFAMGIQGTEVAKSAADVIIMDDNFVSIVAAVKWGRCVYDNICKFLQFQLTVNIAACIVACVGAAVLTESPLSAIQLLWVNLIMDSFASLALATEDPHPSLLTRKPYPRDQRLLSSHMIRFMLCHSAWQLLVLTTVLFYMGDVCEGHGDICTGPVLVNFLGSFRSGRPASFDLNTLPGTCLPVADREMDYCAQTHGHNEPTRHYTIFFTTFVLMQVFNEVNARKINGEINVFGGILKQPLFLIIVLGTIIVQVAMVETPSINAAFGCTKLSRDEWIVCFGLGFSSIPINALIHLVPLRWFTKEMNEEPNAPLPVNQRRRRSYALSRSSSGVSSTSETPAALRSTQLDAFPEEQNDASSSPELRRRAAARPS